MSEQTQSGGAGASEESSTDATPATAAAAAQETQHGDAPRRVLVAEDETLIRLDIVEILGGAGYEVVGEADNGERAVELARETEPDLVVMDVKMPIMDGITAAKIIAEERIAPVVMLTAFSQRDLVESAREAGAMAYVVKPFTENDLVPAVEVAMARFDEIRALEDEVTSLADKFETRKLVERAKSLLTTKMGLTEPEAFRWIQKTSMDRRLSMREVAETVVDQMTDSPPYLK
ncbi:response regulator NasT [Nesterenkonia halotolerans]|uniref:Response regulator NasT n=1 Tax=Nesterenkonia halotolerans TaxID=225325 RepID=A0ABR9J4U3_9MICC|nr:response regulator NasT [Nesterenkonia halotolerans]